MARVDYVFKTVAYGSETVSLTATVHFLANPGLVKGIGEILRESVIQISPK